jgi:aquaglyceroporin related protein
VIRGGTVLALGDDTNSPPGAGMHAFILGLVGFAMASTLGYNTGPQTNPAKDLASRLVPWWTGYGSPMWAKSWWAEAWVASIVGGLVGCLIYDIAIYEGEESPVNYSMAKRKESRRGNKRMWWKTGLFGRSKKAKGKQDLEEGAVGINEKGAGRKLDGH